MTDADGPSGEAATVAEFLDLYVADTARGAPRTLPEYQALFSGFESAVARKFEEIASLRRGGGVEQIGPFRLIREAGRGGQGTVHLAEDPRLGRRVALKILRGFASMPSELLARFRREAALASRLSHPGICQVFDSGLDGGDAWIAMRWVEGDTLARRIHQRKSAPECRPPGAKEIGNLVAIFEGAARALHAAHEAGVIHRDIKPGNLMLEADAGSSRPAGSGLDAAGERIVLVDFGLAHESDDDLAALTRTGDVVGTPAYLAPEQLGSGRRRGGSLADIYSLGVSLFEAATLRRPFEAPTREGLFRAIETGIPPDPRSLNPAVTTDLRAVILTAIDADPGRRYRSAAEFAEDLRRVRAREPVRARPAGALLRMARFAQRNPVVAASVAIALFALGTGLLITLLALASTARERDRKDDALRGYEQLSDALLLQELFAECESLWPRRPERVPAMESWLTRARRVASRRSQHAEALDRLRGAGPAGPEVRWRAAVLGQVLRDLDRLQREVEEVADRVDRARLIADESLIASGSAWEACVRNLSASSAFAGLNLRPCVGLVPLGRDEESGLFEFWHVDSGSRPGWSGRFESGTVRIGEDSGIVLVLVPGGTFTLGAQSGNPDAPGFDENARSDEAPHGITLDPFFIGKHELTQGQWMRIAGSNPSILSPSRPNAPAPWTLLHPVENVDRSAAVWMLARLALELPTEVQWEYACRGGTVTPWWTGNDRQSLRGSANLADAALARTKSDPALGSPEIWLDDGYAQHAPAGKFAPNPFGLHDTHGNVIEWCRDGYDRNPGPARAGDGLRVDPSTTEVGIARGGSFLTDAIVARSAARFAPRAANSAVYLGIRPVQRLVAR